MGKMKNGQTHRLTFSIIFCILIVYSTTVTSSNNQELVSKSDNVPSEESSKAKDSQINDSYNLNVKSLTRNRRSSVNSVNNKHLNEKDGNAAFSSAFRYNDQIMRNLLKSHSPSYARSQFLLNLLKPLDRRTTRFNSWNDHSVMHFGKRSIPDESKEEVLTKEVPLDATNSEIVEDRNNPIDISDSELEKKSSGSWDNHNVMHFGKRNDESNNQSDNLNLLEKNLGDENKRSDELYHSMMSFGKKSGSSWNDHNTMHFGKKDDPWHSMMSFGKKSGNFWNDHNTMHFGKKDDPWHSMMSFGKRSEDFWNDHNTMHFGKRDDPWHSMMSFGKKSENNWNDHNTMHFGKRDYPKHDMMSFGKKSEDFWKDHNTMHFGKRDDPWHSMMSFGKKSTDSWNNHNTMHFGKKDEPWHSMMSFGKKSENPFYDHNTMHFGKRDYESSEDNMNLEKKSENPWSDHNTMHFGKKNDDPWHSMMSFGKKSENAWNDHNTMHFGKRYSSDPWHNTMNFGKRSPNPWSDHNTMHFGKRNEDLMHSMMSFGKKDDFRHGMMNFGKRTEGISNDSYLHVEYPFETEMGSPKRSESMWSNHNTMHFGKRGDDDVWHNMMSFGKKYDNSFNVPNIMHFGKKSDYYYLNSDTDANDYTNLQGNNADNDEGDVKETKTFEKRSIYQSKDENTLGNQAQLINQKLFTGGNSDEEHYLKSLLNDNLIDQKEHLKRSDFWNDHNTMHFGKKLDPWIGHNTMNFGKKFDPLSDHSTMHFGKKSLTENNQQDLTALLIPNENLHLEKRSSTADHHLLNPNKNFNFDKAHGKLLIENKFDKTKDNESVHRNSFKEEPMVYNSKFKTTNISKEISQSQFENQPVVKNKEHNTTSIISNSNTKDFVSKNLRNLLSTNTDKNQANLRIKKRSINELQDREGNIINKSADDIDEIYNDESDNNILKFGQNWNSNEDNDIYNVQLHAPWEIQTAMDPIKKSDPWRDHNTMHFGKKADPWSTHNTMHFGKKSDNWNSHNTMHFGKKYDPWQAHNTMHFGKRSYPWQAHNTMHFGKKSHPWEDHNTLRFGKKSQNSWSPHGVMHFGKRNEEVIQKNDFPRNEQFKSMLQNLLSSQETLPEYDSDIISNMDGSFKNDESFDGITLQEYNKLKNTLLQETDLSDKIPDLLGAEREILKERFQDEDYQDQIGNKKMVIFKTPTKDENYFEIRQNLDKIPEKRFLAPFQGPKSIVYPHAWLVSQIRRSGSPNRQYEPKVAEKKEDPINSFMHFGRR